MCDSVSCVRAAGELLSICLSAHLSASAAAAANLDPGPRRDVSTQPSSENIYVTLLSYFCWDLTWHNSYVRACVCVCDQCQDPSCVPVNKGRIKASLKAKFIAKVVHITAILCL